MGSPLVKFVDYFAVKGRLIAGAGVVAVSALFLLSSVVAVSVVFELSLQDSNETATIKYNNAFFML